ncbi:hypothetical protein ACJX0J_020566, partial [Zea mays]
SNIAQYTIPQYTIAASRHHYIVRVCEPLNSTLVLFRRATCLTCPVGYYVF